LSSFIHFIHPIREPQKSLVPIIRSSNKCDQNKDKKKKPLRSGNYFLFNGYIRKCEGKDNWNLNIALLLRKVTLPVVLMFPWIQEPVPSFFFAFELIFLYLDLDLVPSIITKVLDTITARLNKSMPPQFNENEVKQHHLEIGVDSLCIDSVKYHQNTNRHKWYVY